LRTYAEAWRQEPAKRRFDEAEKTMNLDDLYRLLRLAHVQAQNIVDTVREPLLVLDDKLCVVAASRSFFQVFGVDRDATLGRHLYELGDGQWDIPDLRHLLEAVIPRSTAVEGYQVEHEFPHLGRRTMRLDARKLFHPDHNSTTFLLAIEDITDGFRKEQENELLLGDLRHRVKNLLALVHSLARQTEVEGRSAEDYRDAFLGRLGSLVQAHELTFEAAAAVDLDELIGCILAPYAADPATITIKAGPRVQLPQRQVTPLCLILHELAVNSVKHGALSSLAGQIQVGWWNEDEAPGSHRLRLRWEEQGGPEVQQPATHGFGTRLIKFAAIHELHGRAELTFAPAGLQAEIAFPLG
jgi:two-component sensor histidine kinase